MPPHYLFPSANNASSPFPDDLTQLVVLLTGPQGTPYSQGLWRLHLRMPEDYPQSPPKAAFRTRIWHPNVDESTGAVCVDTLKKDWEPKLTLRDVLIVCSFSFSSFLISILPLLRGERRRGGIDNASVLLRRSAHKLLLDADDILSSNPSQSGFRLEFRSRQPASG